MVTVPYYYYNNVFVGFSGSPMFIGGSGWWKGNGESGGGEIWSTSQAGIACDAGIGDPGDYEVTLGVGRWVGFGISWDEKNTAIVGHVGAGTPSYLGPITISGPATGYLKDYCP